MSDNELFNEYNPLPGSPLHEALTEQDKQTAGIIEVETAQANIQEQHAAAAATLAALRWDSSLDEGRTAAAELPLLERLLHAAASELARRRDEKRLHDKSVYSLVSQLKEAESQVLIWSRAHRVSVAMAGPDGTGVSPEQVQNDERKHAEAVENLGRVRSRLLGC